MPVCQTSTGAWGDSQEETNLGLAQGLLIPEKYTIQMWRNTNITCANKTEILKIFYQIDYGAFFLVSLRAALKDMFSEGGR